MVAEMERKFIRDRQQAGIEKAKAEGVYKGRKPSVDQERIKSLYKAGKGQTEIAETLGISRMSVHRVLKAASMKDRRVQQRHREDIELERTGVVPLT